MEILATVLVIAVLFVVFWDNLAILTRTWQSRSEQPSWKKHAVTVLTKVTNSTTLQTLICIAIPFTVFRMRKTLKLETAEAIVFICILFLAYWIIGRVPFYFLDRKDDLKEDK